MSGTKLKSKPILVLVTMNIAIGEDEVYLSKMDTLQEDAKLFEPIAVLMLS